MSHLYVKAPGSWLDQFGLTPCPIMKAYGGPGGGHHIPAKAAFQNAANYDPLKALALSNSDMDKLNIDHRKITGAQQKGIVVALPLARH